MFARSLTAADGDMVTIDNL